MCKCKIRT